MRRVLVVAVFASILAWGAGARAWFERPVVSSRQLAMGGALVSVSADASSAIINPAALVQLHRWSAVSTYQRPYGVADLDEAFAAAAVKVDGVGAAALAVHYTGLRDVMSESMVTFALARDLIRTSEDASLSVGASVDVARVAVQDRFDVSETAVTGGASILLRPFPAIGIAYAMRNINEPDIDLLAGGGSTPLERAQSWGLSYVWHQRVGFVYERRHDGSRWRDHAGVEIDLGPNLDVRTGVGRGLAAGGIGVTWNGVTLDAGFSSHEYLGSSYVVSFGYAPPAPPNPYEQTP